MGDKILSGFNYERNKIEKYYTEDGLVLSAGEVSGIYFELEKGVCIYYVKDNNGNMHKLNTGSEGSFIKYYSPVDAEVRYGYINEAFGRLFNSFNRKERKKSTISWFEEEYINEEISSIRMIDGEGNGFIVFEKSLYDRFGIEVDYERESIRLYDKLTYKYYYPDGIDAIKTKTGSGKDLVFKKGKVMKGKYQEQFSKEEIILCRPANGDIMVSSIKSIVRSNVNGKIYLINEDGEEIEFKETSFLYHFSTKKKDGSGYEYWRVEDRDIKKVAEKSTAFTVPYTANNMLDDILLCRASNILVSTGSSYATIGSGDSYSYRLDKNGDIYAIDNEEEYKVLKITLKNGQEKYNKSVLQKMDYYDSDKFTYIIDGEKTSGTLFYHPFLKNYFVEDKKGELIELKDNDLVREEQKEDYVYSKISVGRDGEIPIMIKNYVAKIEKDTLIFNDIEKKILSILNEDIIGVYVTANDGGGSIRIDTEELKNYSISYKYGETWIRHKHTGLEWNVIGYVNMEENLRKLKDKLKSGGLISYKYEEDGKEILSNIKNDNYSFAIAGDKIIFLDRGKKDVTLELKQMSFDDGTVYEIDKQKVVSINKNKQEITTEDEDKSENKMKENDRENIDRILGDIKNILNERLKSYVGVQNTEQVKINIEHDIRTFMEHINIPQKDYELKLNTFYNPQDMVYDIKIEEEALNKILKSYAGEYSMGATYTGGTSWTGGDTFGGYSFDEESIKRGDIKAWSFPVNNFSYFPDSIKSAENRLQQIIEDIGKGARTQEYTDEEWKSLKDKADELIDFINRERKKVSKEAPQKLEMKFVPATEYSKPMKFVPADTILDKEVEKIEDSSWGTALGALLVAGATQALMSKRQEKVVEEECLS